MKTKVIILLSTYNGSCFVKAQIDSIINQNYPNWVLLVRDDGSTDDTLTILKKYADKDGRIIIDRSNDNNLGPKLSFSYLMQQAYEYKHIDYFMFCDQDDVWLPNKLELQLDRIEQMRRQYGYFTPLMVFSDLLPTDEKLSPYHQTFLQINKFNGYYNLDNILINNFVAGCTIMINRSLLGLATPVPSFEIMHDAWVASVAKVCGKVFFIEQPLLYYRQHYFNMIGLRKKSLILRIFKKILNSSKRIEYVSQKANKLLNLLSKYDTNTKEILKRYADLWSQNRFRRFYTVLKFRMFPQGTIRLIAWLVMLVFAKRSNKL